jgi:exonuclease SbcC
MRPHRLRVTAFGAFGGTVEVSFEDLACSGLFLLHGETGAGKTTLLDAIGFALYGRVPGERGKARRLRSDHAAPGTPTEVQLEATLGGRRMRITRKPEQERAKLRGAGTTTEQARVLLEEQAGGSWRAVSTRVGEADAEIADLMGMSADQFFQVVLLPQGEFARFLHADAGDRAKLLQRLFGTDRFHAVEEWLARRRKATADEVREAEAGISGLLARVARPPRRCRPTTSCPTIRRRPPESTSGRRRPCRRGLGRTAGRGRRRAGRGQPGRRTAGSSTARSTGARTPNG